MNPITPKKASEIHVGLELTAPPRVMSGMIMRTRQWHGTNLVHSDPTLAARQGMKKPPATGQISAAYIQQMCIELLGEAIFLGSTFDCRFRRPVYEDDRLTTGGRVDEVTPKNNGKKIVINAWCKNQDGVEVTTAHVEVFVSDKK